MSTCHSNEYRNKPKMYQKAECTYMEIYFLTRYKTHIYKIGDSHFFLSSIHLMMSSLIISRKITYLKSLCVTKIKIKIKIKFEFLGNVLSNTFTPISSYITYIFLLCTHLTFLVFHVSSNCISCRRNNIIS